MIYFPRIGNEGSIKFHTFLVLEKFILSSYSIRDIGGPVLAGTGLNRERQSFFIFTQFKMASGGNHHGSDQNRLLLGRLTQLVTSLNQNKSSPSQQPRPISVDEMLSRLFPSGNRTVSQSVTQSQIQSSVAQLVAPPQSTQPQPAQATTASPSALVGLELALDSLDSAEAGLVASHVQPSSYNAGRRKF